MAGAVILARAGGGGPPPAPRTPRASRKPRFGSRLLRWGRMALGVLIMIAGFLIAPLPGPFGLPIAVVGLMMVLQSSMQAKRHFIRLKRRHPNWIYPLRRLMRRRPEFFAVFWQMTLRTERMVLRRARFLGRWRRRTFRRKPRAQAIVT